MSVQTLISPSGEFNATSLESLGVDPDDSVSVITTLSAYNLDQSKLLDQVFGTEFSSSSSQGITTALVNGDDSAVMTEAPHNSLILNVEPFDGPDRSREELRERAFHFSLSICDALLFIVRMNDLSRVQTNGIASLRAGLTHVLMLQADDVVPAPKEKRAFIVIVRNHEAEVLPRDEIISGFLQEMQVVYQNVAKPPRSPPRVTDLFDFEFILLPSEKLFPEDYENAVTTFRTRLLDPAVDDYFFEGARFSKTASTPLREPAAKAWEKLDTEQTGDIPPTKDLMSAFDCDNAMRKVFEKYQRGVRVWRREADGGVIIEKFGEAASDMVQKTISVYEQDAAPHKGSKAFKRKKEELRDLLDADLYNLFIVQIAKLREVTYRMFKEKVSAIEDSEPRLEKAVDNALKDSQKSFRANAEALRPKITSWRYDNDTKELATQMREDATEKLQRARIADYQESGGRSRRRRAPISGGKPRQPINVSFHYLDPAPFGWRDSRYEKLSVDDNLSFNGSNAAPTGSGVSGISAPLAPARDSDWHKKNQDFIYTERK